MPVKSSKVEEFKNDRQMLAFWQLSRKLHINYFMFIVVEIKSMTTKVSLVKERTQIEIIEYQVNFLYFLVSDGLSIRPFCANGDCFCGITTSS